MPLLDLEVPTTNSLSGLQGVWTTSPPEGSHAFIRGEPHQVPGGITAGLDVLEEFYGFS